MTLLHIFVSLEWWSTQRANDRFKDHLDILIDGQLTNATLASWGFSEDWRVLECSQIEDALQPSPSSDASPS